MNWPSMRAPTICWKRASAWRRSIHCIDVDELQVVEVNAGDVLLQEGRGKHVALVGHFPFIPQLRLSAGELWVIEQQPAAGEYPAEAAVDLIPRAEVVAITGTTLINHTLDNLLALCNPQALVMVLGPQYSAFAGAVRSRRFQFSPARRSSTKPPRWAHSVRARPFNKWKGCGW